MMMNKMNLIGRNFGDLTVIEETKSAKGRIRWKCRCKCGVILESVIGSNLVRGNTTSCGCKCLTSKKYNFVDLNGRTFGKLTVIEKLDKKTKTRGILWKCLCECGNYIELPSNSLTSGNTISCGNKKIHIKAGKDVDEWRVGEIPISHLTSIKQNAIKRNLHYEVSNEYLWNLFLSQNKKCVLSGVELTFTKNSNASKYRACETNASLDRINNQIGYVEGNVRWLHKDINRIRGQFNDTQFLEWCKKCYLHSNSTFNYTPPIWDEWFMRGIYWAATKSKDIKTKIAAFIVKDNRIISTGFNGIPQGVDDGIYARNQRPLKYSYYSHGEENAIYNAARNGISTEKSILYTNALPCNHCCKCIIQSGIKKVVIHKQYNDLWKSYYREEWNGQDKITKIMFSEAGVELIEFDKILNVSAYLDGKIVSV